MLGGYLPCSEAQKKARHIAGKCHGGTFEWTLQTMTVQEFQEPEPRVCTSSASSSCLAQHPATPGCNPRGQSVPCAGWGSLSPALGEKPRLHVIFPARLPPAQKCCPGLKRNSTQLSQFCFLLLTHSAGVKISHAHIHMQRTFIKQWLRGGQKAPALDQSSPGQKQWEADLDPTRPLSSLWEVILSVRHSVFPSAK